MGKVQSHLELIRCYKSINLLQPLRQCAPKNPMATWVAASLACRIQPPMFKRLRHLEISLAAKCQLLFGAAVVLIIGAALFVPWQRIGQLTAELNERAASAVAENAL